MVRDGGGWRPLRAVPRVAMAGAISVPVVLGFVVLGAGVIVVRSLRDVARETWAWIPSLRGTGRGGDQSRSDAA